MPTKQTQRSSIQDDDDINQAPVFQLGSVAIPQFKPDSLRTFYHTSVLSDGSLEVSTTCSTKSCTSCSPATTGKPSSQCSKQANRVHIYTRKKELRELRARKFDEYTRKVVLNNGTTLRGRRVLAKVDLGFPGQIAGYLSIAAHAAVSNPRLHAMTKSRMDLDPGYYALKASAACFYAAVAVLVRELPLSNSLANTLSTPLYRFDLGYCGPLSDSYQSLEHVKSVCASDSVEIIDCEITILRWLYFGLAIDPDVTQTVKIPSWISIDEVGRWGYLQHDNHANRNTGGISKLERTYLSTWHFYEPLCELLSKKEYAWARTKHHGLVAGVLSLTTHDKSRFPKSWITAVRWHEGEDFNIAKLAEVFECEIIDDEINVLSLAKEVTKATEKYQEDCRKVVVEPLGKELGECYEMFWVRPLICGKWMVV